MKLKINLKPLYPNNVIFSECFSFARMFAAFIKEQGKTKQKPPKITQKNPHQNKPKQYTKTKLNLEWWNPSSLIYI